MTDLFIHSTKVSVKKHIGINTMPDTDIDKWSQPLPKISWTSTRGDR